MGFRDFLDPTRSSATAAGNSNSHPGRRTLTDGLSPAKMLVASVKNAPGFDVGGRPPAPNESFSKVVAYGVNPTIIGKVAAASIAGLFPGAKVPPLEGLTDFGRLVGWAGIAITEKHREDLKFFAEMGAFGKAKIQGSLTSQLMFASVVPTGNRRQENNVVNKTGTSSHAQGTSETDEAGGTAGVKVPVADISFGATEKHVSQETANDSQGEGFGQTITAQNTGEEFEVTVFLMSAGEFSIIEVIPDIGGDSEIGSRHVVHVSLPPLHLGRFKIWG